MTKGELIRKYRKEKGLTQAELSEISGVSHACIGQWETNFRNPTVESLKKLADALNVPLACFLQINHEGYREKTLQDFTTDELLEEIKRRIEGRK